MYAKREMQRTKPYEMECRLYDGFDFFGWLNDNADDDGALCWKSEREMVAEKWNEWVTELMLRKLKN